MPFAHEESRLPTTYAVVTALTALFTAVAAVTYLIGHEYPKTQLDMKRLPRSWAPVLGGLLAAGSVGLLVGFAVPVVGTIAAAGLVLYFVGAIAAHVRVGSRDVVGGIVFLVASVAALAVGLARHGG